ncbi:TonB C-terminal domain-containing protein [Sandaracinobacteroides sp. A072]|uniref:TonB C-terminal domain-containing protein n=1 Tax=Sandaracinobacteroides sp. A072 TaxID=3461146 RepID=UPI0040415738
MTEKGALAVAGGLHLLLFAALSLGLAQALPPMNDNSDSIPIEFVEIAETAAVTTPPRPSMEAAPRETGETPPAPQPEPAPPPPVPAPPAPPAPAVEPVRQAPADTAPQDAIAEERRPPAPPRAAQRKPAPPAKFDAGAMAALIDKSLPEAPQRPRDTSAFARSIEQAIPKGARLSPVAMATLEQAIRAQIAPCWNPPIGGADVAGMTAVLKIRLNRDGTVAGAPEFVSQTGATAGNQAYARAFVETARRAVLRCAPLRLPDDLFPYWREFELNFDPRMMT